MKELEEYAKINNIPIMQKDGILYLINYIKENNIKNILEIGSAIGYSSIMMASINSDIRITTIERDKDRYDLAVFNIKKYNLDKQINIIYGDAVDTDITGMYDLIFIDAAKGKNIFFFEKGCSLPPQRKAPQDPPPASLGIGSRPEAPLFLSQLQRKPHRWPQALLPPRSRRP